MIAEDEIRKQTVIYAEFAAIPEEFDASLDVEILVLQVIGDQDVYFCGEQRCSAQTGAGTTEPQLWPNADFTMEIIPGTSHNVYQHEGTASDVFAIIKE